jgi:hypothetical protein
LAFRPWAASAARSAAIILFRLVAELIPA